MQTVHFEEYLDKIIAKDPRFHREAYLFLRDALDHTQKTAPKKSKGGVRHVTGKQLLEGIRQYGLAQFGPMTVSLFKEWGVNRCEDWGEIVFNLIDSELLSKTETDSRADFQDGYDFFEAFRKPFLPAKNVARELPAAHPD